MLYVAVSERLTARLINEMRPLSNLPSKNFVTLSTENFTVVLQLQTY